MRISDWSSDVCSSDLPGHIRRLALVRRQTQLRVAREMFDRAEILARGELHVARGHIVLEVDPSRPRARIAVGEMQRRSDRRRERRLNIVALPRRAAAGERDIEIEDTSSRANIHRLLRRLARQESFERRRSEEHTSELQSLMRTSYAVFCL